MANKWSSEQITVLIDAYKEEPCLYVTNSPNYHNKNLRNVAFSRVRDAVSRLKLTVTTKECSNKFHNLRNQFSYEHAKVKSSLKSGTGTDDVYVPSLWYYEKLLFLESYINSRKSRTSFGSEVSLSDVSLSQGAATNIIEESPEDADHDENIEYLEDDFIAELDQMNQVQENIGGTSSAEQVLGTNTTSLHVPNSSSSLSPQISRSSSLSSVKANIQQKNVFTRPSSPLRSDSSTSGICTPNERKKRYSRSDSSDEFSDVIKSLTTTIKEPVTVRMHPTTSTADPIEGFLMFLGSSLRGFRDEELKLEVMNEVSQLIINAKTTDCQRSKR